MRRARKRQSHRSKQQRRGGRYSSSKPAYIDSYLCKIVRFWTRSGKMPGVSIVQAARVRRRAPFPSFRPPCDMNKVWEAKKHSRQQQRAAHIRQDALHKTTSGIVAKTRPATERPRDLCDWKTCQIKAERTAPGTVPLVSKWMPGCLCTRNSSGERCPCHQ